MKIEDQSGRHQIVGRKSIEKKINGIYIKNFSYVFRE